VPANGRAALAFLTCLKQASPPGSADELLEFAWRELETALGPEPPSHTFQAAAIQSLKHRPFDQADASDHPGCVVMKKTLGGGAIGRRHESQAVHENGRRHDVAPRLRLVHHWLHAAPLSSVHVTETLGPPSPMLKP